MACVFVFVRTARQGDLCLVIQQFVLNAGFLIQSNCVEMSVTAGGGLMLEELHFLGSEALWATPPDWTLTKVNLKSKVPLVSSCPHS